MSSKFGNTGLRCAEILTADTQCIALLWGRSANESITFGRFKMVDPGKRTTWASGRNFLLEQAREVEKKQGWLFEYLVFVDGDVFLQYRTSQQGPAVVDHAKAVGLLHASILENRPPRASVEATWDRISDVGMSCLMTCSMDTMTDYYHRTIVDCLLPYSTTHDADDWWRSAYTLNMKSTILIRAVLLRLPTRHCAMGCE